MGKMNSTMMMVAICQEFGWTYAEYISQPNFFLELIKQKLTRDSKEQELQAKQARRGR